MTSESKIEPSSTFEEQRLVELKDERERALACALLSLAISLALVLSNFPGDRKPIEAARKEVAEHTKLLTDTQSVLLANEQVLAQNQQALADVRKSTTTP